MRGGLGENVRMAMDTIRANKLRSSLTTLAIVIAITAIVVVSSVVNGLNGAVRSQVSEMGSNLIWVFRFDVFQFGRPSEELRTRKELSIEDAEALRGLPHVRAVSPSMRLFMPEFGVGTYAVKYGDKRAKNTILEGSTPEGLYVYDFNSQEGRWFTDFEEEHRSPVVVIGHDTAEALFGNGSALGKEVNIEGELFQVIGVIAKRKDGVGGCNDHARIRRCGDGASATRRRGRAAHHHRPDHAGEAGRNSRRPLEWALRARHRRGLASRGG